MGITPFRRSRNSRASEDVHSFHDCSDDWTTGAQRALPMRFGPQIQTVLPREGRRPGQHGPRRSRARRECAVGGGGGSYPSPEAPYSTAVEDDHVAWLPRAVAHTTQGRRRLTRPSSRFDPRSYRRPPHDTGDAKRMPMAAATASENAHPNTHTPRARAVLV